MSASTRLTAASRPGAAGGLDLAPVLSARDMAGLREALLAAGLPADDIGEPGRRFFRVAEAGGLAVGHAGLEALGEGAVLLRSNLTQAELTPLVAGLQARGRIEASTDASLRILSDNCI